MTLHLQIVHLIATVQVRLFTHIKSLSFSLLKNEACVFTLLVWTCIETKAAIVENNGSI